MTLLYTAGGCLVLAQLVGLYGLKTRKADLIFALFMVALLLASGVLGVMGALQEV